MTNQEIFDKVLTHLRVQGRASVEEGVGCMYRGPGGTSCAVGCLIPNYLYDPVIEGLSADCSRTSKALGVSIASRDKFLAIMDGLGFNDNQRSFLQRLQGAHDLKLAERGIEAWEEKMAEIAFEEGLTYQERV